MKFRLLPAALALCLCALHASTAPAADPAHGAAEGHGEGLWVLARHALNLFFLAFLLTRFALPALRDFLRQRAQGLREQVDSANRSLLAAQAELAELRAQLARADEESGELVAEAERAAEAERQRSLARAQESSQRLREDARRIADQEVERARGVLRGEAAALATDLAAQLLAERLEPADDRRLFDEFTGRVGSAS